MKQAILDLMRMTGGFATFRLVNRRKFLILAFHHFSEGEAHGKVSAAVFAQQLAYLRARYTILSLSEVERRLTHGEPLPQASVALTIDDGYRDAYEIAFPILKRFNAPATLFAVTDFIDGRIWLWTDKVPYIVLHTRARRLSMTIDDSTIDVAFDSRDSRLDAALRINALLKRAPDHVKDAAIDALAVQAGVQLPERPPREYSPVTWDELREMDAAGLEIGSHTVTHPILLRIDGQRLDRELQESRQRLESQLDREVPLFCYPNGDYDRAVRDAAERAGYRLAVTMDPGLNDAGCDPLAIRRIHTSSDLTHFIQSTSGFEQVKERLNRVIAAGGTHRPETGRSAPRA